MSTAVGPGRVHANWVDVIVVATASTCMSIARIERYAFPIVCVFTPDSWKSTNFKRNFNDDQNASLLTNIIIRIAVIGIVHAHAIDPQADCSKTSFLLSTGVLRGCAIKRPCVTLRCWNIRIGLPRWSDGIARNRVWAHIHVRICIWDTCNISSDSGPARACRLLPRRDNGSNSRGGSSRCCRCSCCPGSPRCR